MIHPEQGRQQRTDVDIFAIRLPHRAELPGNPMCDDSILFPEGDRTKVILVEVKKETCNLKGLWTRKGQANMQLAIAAAGPFQRVKVEEAAEALSEHEIYQDNRITMMLFV